MIKVKFSDLKEGLAINYDIHSFAWNSKTRTFRGDEIRLWDMGTYFQYSFPSGRRQFFIRNTNTGGFRRFRLQKETKRTLIFVSEDFIICRIKKITKAQEKALTKKHKMKIYQVSFDTNQITVNLIGTQDLFMVLYNADNNFGLKDKQIYYDFGNGTKVDCFVEDVTNKPGILQWESH